MILQLNRIEIHALAEALCQYIENQPDCDHEFTDDELDRIAAAERLGAMLDAKMAAAAGQG